MNTGLALPTVEERKQWWTLVYAHKSFEMCRATCCQMLEVVNGTRHPLYIPFAVTVHAFYCRPFMTQRGASRLTRDYVPSGFRGLHDAIFTFRDKVFAHSDSDTIDETQRPLNDLLYSVSQDCADYFITEPRPYLDHYAPLLDLLPMLIKKTFQDFHVFHKRYFSLLPVDFGDHLFMLKGDSLFSDYVEPSPHMRFTGQA